LIARSDVEEKVGHREEAEMSFICSARSDDSTPVNSTWYRLELDHFTGELYEARVENRSAANIISSQLKGKERKEVYLYSAFIVATTLKALRRGSHSFTCK